MKMRLLAALFLFAMPSIGCGPTEVVRSTRWNVHDRLVAVDDGVPAPPEVAEIIRGAPFRVQIELSPKHLSDAVEHDGKWVFYKDGRPFGRMDADDIDFTRVPTIVALDAHSSSKMVGSYTYELFIDDELVTEVPVEILPPPKFQPMIEH